MTTECESSTHLLVWLTKDMSSCFAEVTTVYVQKGSMCIGALDAWIDFHGIVDDSDTVSKKSALLSTWDIMQGWSGYIMGAAAAAVHQKKYKKRKNKSNGQMSGFIKKLQNQCVIHFPLSEWSPVRKNTLMKRTGQCNKPETNIS